MKRYEMLWDCGYCGTKKLLGLTHRHCPNCGAAQNPSSRYFPQEHEKVAVTNHQYTGKDKQCKACATASSALAYFCVACGNPLSEGDQVVTKSPEKPAAVTKTAQKSKAKRAKAKPGRVGSREMKVLGAIFAVLALCAVAAHFISFERSTIVTGKSWERSVSIEVFREMDESSRCSSVPSGGRVYNSYTQSVPEQVEDGQDCSESCSNVNVDLGDGTFTSRQECSQSCTTRYRTVMVDYEYCDYKIGRWTFAREVRASGSESQIPEWPKFSLAAGHDGFDHERESGREESYQLALIEGEEKLNCKLAALSSWDKHQPGQPLIVQQNLYGVVTCPESPALAH